MPLGYPHRKILTYKPIRLSAFVFRGPEQWRAMRRQVERFERSTGCGLEALALRRGYGDRPSRSLRAIAEEIFDRIQAGDRDLSKAMHLTRPTKAIREAAGERRAEAERLGDEARATWPIELTSSGSIPTP